MSHPQRHRHPQYSASKFWLVCWLALALLSFQTLGHLHRHAHAHAASASAAQGASLAALKLPGLDGWGHQSGDLSCQLFDQLSQDHAPGGQFSLDIAAESHLQPVATPWVNGCPASHWKRGARGPPLLA
ncbi:hypothetical protein [Roseateles oligotrophus]|uniref:DUF2946 domain-containing protein n=1 Tax=Roseateles oligotrophus TaxID=1769250 RepID=A0ABT2YLQ1_9BURK|nr:hypothetical protein [Roseateles oligotrophus]MCV2370995.1 hypothetical protein [Roseateles oligotrophus]